MHQDAKKKTLSAIGRLEGLTTRLRTMVEEGDYCPRILEIALAMQGQLKYIHGTVLENHLRTCAAKKLASTSKAEREKCIAELLTIIGLSTRS